MQLQTASMSRRSTGWGQKGDIRFFGGSFVCDAFGKSACPCRGRRGDPDRHDRFGHEHGSQGFMGIFPEPPARNIRIHVCAQVRNTMRQPPSARKGNPRNRGYSHACQSGNRMKPSGSRGRITQTHSPTSGRSKMRISLYRRRCTIRTGRSLCSRTAMVNRKVQERLEECGY